MEASPQQSPSPARSPGRPAKPRLFIKEMVLRNFKSYAGEQRIGPFHKVSPPQTSALAIFFLYFVLILSIHGKEVKELGDTRCSPSSSFQFPLVWQLVWDPRRAVCIFDLHFLLDLYDP